MAKFRVMIEGRDFAGKHLGEDDKIFGFFTTRWVETRDAETAESAAVASIRTELAPHFEPPVGGETGPTLHVSELIEVADFPPDFTNGGATWFAMQSEE